MASIEIKRAYKRPTPRDGKRILVDRLWPRGLRKAAASLDLWSKEVATDVLTESMVRSSQTGSLSSSNATATN